MRLMSLSALLPALISIAPMAVHAETLDVMVYTPFEITKEMVLDVHGTGNYDPAPLVSGSPTAVFTVTQNGEARNVPVWMRTRPNPHNDMIRVEYAIDGSYPLNIPAANYAPGYGPQGYLQPHEHAPAAAEHVVNWELAVLLPGESFEFKLPDSNATVRATLRLPLVETIPVTASGVGKPLSVSRTRPFDNRGGSVP